MPKWEYYVLQNTASPTVVGVFGYTPDGKRLRFSEQSGTTELVKVLNKLGSEGWEVISNAAEGYNSTWTLRRLLPD